MKKEEKQRVFQVFEPGYMQGSFFTKLAYWLKNVYLYHYLKYTIFFVLGAIAAVSLISTVATRQNNDLDFIIGGGVMVPSENTQELVEYLRGEIGDANGNGKSEVGFQMLCTGSIYDNPDAAELFDEMASAAINKIQISFADDSVLLFILDNDFIRWYCDEGAFEPLSTFGMDSENGFFIRVDETEVFKKFGIANSDGWYAAIKVITPSRAENEKTMERYATAVAALKAIIGENE